ncbi:MAG TPA: M14 family zinc carboxypeptidase [Trebonia sp.]|nr:M14 family zinc carboxypeptidase [Trebonia sp.]
MHPAPPAPPDRHATGEFHFHAYDYAAPAPAPFTVSDPVAGAGNLRFYSLVQDLRALRALGEANGVPNIAEASIGRTAGDRDIRMLSLGNAGNDPAAPALMITGGIHAREWIAAEFTYLLAEYLVRHYSDNPVGDYQRALKQLIDSRRIYILPMLNPDGNHTTVFGGLRDWRKNWRKLPGTNDDWVAELTSANPPAINAPLANLAVALNVTYDAPVYNAGKAPAQWEHCATNPHRTGVDLNRNYPTAAWGHAISRLEDGEWKLRGGNASSDTYFGTRGGLEAETRAVQNWLTVVAQAFPGGITAMIDYHSYAQMILYPTEAWDRGEVGDDYKALGKALQELVHTQGQRDYGLGPPRKVIGYDGLGSIVDYAAQQYQARAFTIELDPPHLTPDGFELPENQIEAVFEKNIRGALALLAGPRRGAKGQKALIKQAARQFLDWDVYGRGDRLPT